MKESIQTGIDQAIAILQIRDKKEFYLFLADELGVEGDKVIEGLEEKFSQFRYSAPAFIKFVIRDYIVNLATDLLP